MLRAHTHAHTHKTSITRSGHGSNDVQGAGRQPAAGAHRCRGRRSKPVHVMMAAAGGIGFAHIPTELVVGPPLVLAAVCAQGALALALALATAVSFPARPPRSGGSSTPPPFTAARAQHLPWARGSTARRARHSCGRWRGRWRGGGAAAPHHDDGRRRPQRPLLCPRPRTLHATAAGRISAALLAAEPVQRAVHPRASGRVRRASCTHKSTSTHPSGRIFRGFFPHAGHIDFLRHVWSQNPYSELRARERQGITARARVNAHQRLGWLHAGTQPARACACGRTLQKSNPGGPAHTHLETSSAASHGTGGTAVSRLRPPARRQQPRARHSTWLLLEY